MRGFFLYECGTMKQMILVALIVFGLSLGSFVNAAVWRFHEQQEVAGKRRKKTSSQRDLSITTGRSMCTHCGHVLSAWDLIPVVSYLYLHGRCRYCRKPIEDTPLAEIAVPMVLVASYIWWPYGFSGWGSPGTILFLFWSACVIAFVFLSVYDVRWFLLPDRVVLPLIAFAVIQVFVQATIFSGGWTVMLDAFWGVVSIAGVFFLLYVISKGAWIGFGDVKLAIALGLFVGGPINALLVIFLASLLGCVAALPMLIRGYAKASSRIPFGPFLMAATVIVMLFGTFITGWYSALLGIR